MASRRSLHRRKKTGYSQELVSITSTLQSKEAGESNSRYSWALCKRTLVLVVSLGLFLLLMVVMVLLGQAMAIELEPETQHDALEMIRSKGYSVEAHIVTTSDGYILTIHRIPHGKGNLDTAKQSDSRLPVLLMHALLGSSADWALNNENQSFAYLLADAGFDVWLGNVRGNTYSRNHTTLTPDQSSFWNFSFNEIVQSDFPAIVDYILSVTGRPQLYYVGHSQGTAMGFAGFSSNRALGSKIKRFYALAPSTIIHNIRGVMKMASYGYRFLLLFVRINNEYEFTPVDTFLNRVGRRACAHPLLAVMCSKFLFSITGGPNEQDFNTTRLPVYLSHLPAGSSAVNVAYWEQVAWSGKFGLHDYEFPDLNMKHYGQPTPPLYNISDMQVPTVIFSGGSDWLSTPHDNDILIPKIRHVLQYRKIIPHFHHLDFILGLSTASEVYSDIIDEMKKDQQLE